MFSARLSLSDLIDLCRMLRHQLAAGLSIHQIIKQQAERGRRSFRAIAGRVSEAIQRGANLSEALNGDKAAFPPLFLAMVKLGENTGHMAEIFGEMERYFQLELQLRRQFQMQTLWPKVQFVFATLIVAVLLAVLATLSPGMLPFPFAGLSAAAASLSFLGTVYGTIIAVWIFFRTLTRLGRQRAWLDRLLLNVPMVGPCLRALLMSRFTLALQLTLDTGLSIAKAVRLSLDATGNAYFVSRAAAIALAIKNGQRLHEALEASQLFDSGFLDMVVSSEEGGSVPEMMRHLAEQYQDETKRRMSTLTGMSAGLLAVGVGGFIIWGIITFWMSYFRALDQFR